MAWLQLTHLWVEDAAQGMAVLVLDGPGKRNYLDAAILENIERALSAIEAEPRFNVCVIRSKKGGSFCHGVSAATFAGLPSPAEWEAFLQQGLGLCDRLRQSRIPTVALIAGGCWGAGLELALACRWRVALDTPTTQLGFTELDWGLMPSWGGIEQVLQLAGLQRSLHVLLGGKKLSAREALAWGLVDEVIENDAEMPPALLHDAGRRDQSVRPRRTWRRWLTESVAWGRRAVLRGAERVLRRRLPDDMPAPWEILGAIRAYYERGPDAVRQHVRAALPRLAAGPACGNLLRLQLLRDAHTGGEAIFQRPRHVAILGATPLALHLAAQAALKGCHVVLREKDEMTLGVATLRIVQTMQQDLARGTMSQEQFTSNINRIRPTISWKGFDAAELVIDATAGGLAADDNVVRDLEEHVSSEAVIAAVQPWRELAEWQRTVRQPQRVVGLHFPAPVGRAPLVEVLATPATNDAAKRCAQAFAAMAGKVAVVAQEATGGLISRVLAAGFSETLHLLAEGLLPERVEQAMQRFGMVYTPLEHLDLMGLDEFALSARRLEAVLGEAVADHPIVRHMIEQRWLGMKTGTGFYRHQGKSKNVNASLGRWLRRSFSPRIEPSSAAEQRKLVQDRVVGRMVNEAFRCLDEGVVAGAEQVDLALMLAGWAPHRGGPCRYAEQQGHAVVVALLEGQARQHGERFAPCPGLRRFAP
ncbi:MAG: enoyl-CoA hydratase-related protein [Gemmataceae bacterium]|nr:enoyl-CoA hydratase-related protein [Gemmataceae bacterium]